MLGGTGGSASRISPGTFRDRPSSVLCSPCPQSWLHFQWRVFMAQKASHLVSASGERQKAEGHNLLQVGDWLEWGMGQDLIPRLHPYPCTGTPQPLHLCRCFSPFLVPKLISNSLLNHSLRNCFANKLWAWVLEENNLIIGCCLFSSLRDL